MNFVLAQGDELRPGSRRRTPTELKESKVLSFQPAREKNSYSTPREAMNSRLQLTNIAHVRAHQATSVRTS